MLSVIASRHLHQPTKPQAAPAHLLSSTTYDHKHSPGAPARRGALLQGSNLSHASVPTLSNQYYPIQQACLQTACQQRVGSIRGAGSPARKPLTQAGGMERVGAWQACNLALTHWLLTDRALVLLLLPLLEARTHIRSAAKTDFESQYC